MLPLLIAVTTLNPIGHVNDFAHLLHPETVSSLEATLRNFEAQTGNEIAVVTIDSHGSDETIETYAVKLFEKWGIGKKDKDNGVLLLISRDDKEMRIEVGYGLEPVITDLESAHIISDVLRPAFQAGDYDGGVKAAVERLENDISNGVPQASEPLKHPTAKEIFYLIIFILVLIINIYRWKKGVRGVYPIFIDRGNGGKGGGFGGFGGGRSGGGGASGGW